MRRFYFGRGEIHTAQALAEQQLHLAQESADPLLLVEARAGLGAAALYQGNLAAGRAHLAKGITLYGIRQPQAYGLTIGQNPGTACCIYSSIALWLLGYPAQALQQAHKGLSLAQVLGHPFSLAFALDQVAVIYILRGEWLAVQEHAQAIITIATAQGFALWMAHATLLQGRALAAQGQMAPGLAQMHQGVSAMHATGQMQGKVMTLSLLAEAYALNGEIETALDTLAEALDIVHTRGLRLWEAEVYRLRGEFLLARHGTGNKLTGQHAEAAAACFQQALEVARQQQARAWELRTALSLRQLWQRQGQTLAARQLLADIYGWFTEGFDTADLRAAHALLGL